MLIGVTLGYSTVKEQQWNVSGFTQTCCCAFPQPLSLLPGRKAIDFPNQ